MNGYNVEVRKWTYGAMQYGCKRDAIAAYEGTLPMLGNGFMRTVYKGARGIVYKVAGGRGRHAANDNAANVSEYERMVRIGRFDATLATPCTLYMVNGVAILAMVLRPGDSASASGRAWDVLHAKVQRYNRESGDHIGDMHGQNWRLTPMGRPTVTDVGDVF